MRRQLRRARNLLADLFDRVREPGWPRRIAFLVAVGLILLIPYPLSITGDFEVISLKPVTVRNKVEGTLVDIQVAMGDRVEQGQVVAQLLTDELELQKKRLEASLAEAEARLRLVRKGFRDEEVAMARLRVQELKATLDLKAAEFQREKALFEGNATPKAKLDEARAEHIRAQKSLAQANQELQRLVAGNRPEEIEQALARVEQLKAELAEVDQDLDWTQLKAPHGGRVITPDADLQNLLGTFLERGTPVVEIVAPDYLVAEIQVPENEFGDIELGQEVTLRAFQYPKRTFAGTIETIHPFVETATDGRKANVTVLAQVKDEHWPVLRLHTRGKAKIAIGSSPIGYVLYRRVLRSAFVKLWSWY